jgi:hypothetical protein
LLVWLQSWVGYGSCCTTEISCFFLNGSYEAVQAENCYDMVRLEEIPSVDTRIDGGVSIDIATVTKLNRNLSLIL